MLKKIGVLFLAGSFLASCMIIDPYTGEPKLSNTASGVAIGSAAGALSGLFVGGSSRAQRNAVLIGAGLGALGGGVIGNYMDSQEQELRAQLRGTSVSVSRLGDQIVLNMPENITFNTNQDSVKAQFYSVLNSVGLVFKKYNQSLIDVSGFTDSTGSPAYNQNLSERRALSVAQYLNSQNVDARRISIIGYGASYPIASNASVAGRAKNRRVEIKVSPLRANGY